MELTDSKQEPSECRARERLSSGDKQEREQIRSLCNENYLQGNTLEDKNVLERHSIKTHGKTKELLLFFSLSYTQWYQFVEQM